MRRPTVTQLVDFEKCEKLGILKLTQNETLSLERQRAVNAGVAEHAKLERQTVVDGRCFVASYAYGGDSEEAKRLRLYRDEVLSRTGPGRLVIGLYYALSPKMVLLFRHAPFGIGLSLARWLVSAALGCIEEPERKAVPEKAPDTKLAGPPC